MVAVAPSINAAFLALEAGERSEAEAQCRQALRDWPTNPGALYVLGLVHSERGDEFEALRLFRQAIHVAPTFTATYHALANAYYGLGRLDDAMQVYRQWATVEPQNPEVQHMITAIGGDGAPPRCPDNYVKAHFDAFSSCYDDVLRKTLRYQGPEIIATSLASCLLSGGPTLDVLDAGCGTGLCGPYIRQYCRSLTGVDLADKMVTHARDRGCYDELVVDEVCTFMESRFGAFDAVVSADVLVYFGSLERFMQAARYALRSQGLLLVTTEALPDDAADAYRIQASGRYAHRRSYVRDALVGANLQPLKIEPVTLRWELGIRVQSYCIVARKSE